MGGKTDVQRLLRGVADAFDETEARGFARGIDAAVSCIDAHGRARGGYFAQVAAALSVMVAALKAPS